MDNKTPELDVTPSEKPADGNFRILILDDISHDNEVKVACNKAGFSVKQAHSVKEVMAFLEDRDRADVILCAAYLRNGNIFEFLKSLRKNPAYDASIFMIMALAPGPVGVKMNADVENVARLLGADAFISMPVFDAMQLIAEIRKLLPPRPTVRKSQN